LVSVVGGLRTDGPARVEEALRTLLASAGDLREGIPVPMIQATMTASGLNRDEGARLLRGLLDAGCELPEWLRKVAAPQGAGPAGIPGQRRGPGPDARPLAPIGDGDALDVTCISLAHLGLARTTPRGVRPGPDGEREPDGGTDRTADHESADFGREAEYDVDDGTAESVDPDAGIDLLGLYRSLAQRAPLLTHAEEVDLATRIEAGVLARERLRERTDIDPELADELRAIEADGRKSFDTFVASNLRLVMSLAWKHRNRGIETLDMIQDGNLGLVRSVQKFDHKLGCRFSTYGVWWIRQGIVKGITDHARTIRYPAHVVDRLRRIEALERARKDPLARPPEDGSTIPADTEGEPHRPPPRTLPTTFSLEQASERLGEDELAHVLHRFAKARGPIAELYGFPLDEVRDILDTCPERERYVLARRHGLLGEPATLEVIGGELGVTRERVRQVESRAAARVRAEVLRTLRETRADRGGLGPTHPDATSTPRRPRPPRPA